MEMSKMISNTATEHPQHTLFDNQMHFLQAGGESFFQFNFVREKGIIQSLSNLSYVLKFGQLQSTVGVMIYISCRIFLVITNNVL